jgi:hypothetical protein
MIDKIKILTFAKGNFKESQLLLKKHLDSLGIKNQKHLTDDELPTSFKNQYSDILSYKRGYGYCIWKPYIILEELDLLNDDEILLYIDSTDLPEKSFFDDVIKNFNEREYFFVNRGYNHGQWTKRDTFVLMNCDSPEYFNHVQLEAGIVGLKPNDFNKNLVKEWLDFATNKNILTETPNISGLPNVNNFIEHRYDQSILTNLFIKKKLVSHNLGPDKIKYNFNQPRIY